MPTFSQRQGLKPIKSVVQLQDIDNELRTALWNVLDASILFQVPHDIWRSHTMRYFFTLMWTTHFRRPADTLDHSWYNTRTELRKYFFTCPWHEVYDLIEFVAQKFPTSENTSAFIDGCNLALRQEMSGYRFVNATIIPNTNEQELSEIQLALQASPSPVQVHLQSAIDLLSNRSSPNYRNSVKESISAVEALCSKIAGKKATLADALGEIAKVGRVKIHPALTASFTKLYGYSSDAQGIRHALMDEPNLNLDDAMFVLVSCSAFIHYLMSKTTDAGITL